MNHLYSASSAARAAFCDPRTFKAKAAELKLQPTAVSPDGRLFFDLVAVQAVANALGRVISAPRVMSFEENSHAVVS